MQPNKAISQLPRSYLREILTMAKAEHVISLAGGLPDQGSFPMDLMAESIHALADDSTLFQYGESAGYQPLLDYLRTSFALPENHRTLICNGSQQGLDLITRSFLLPGESVAMEDPGYLGALQLFNLVGADIKTVPQDASGPDTEALEALFAKGGIKLFYCVPDFHNPTGVCWSLETRKKVAELCIAYNVILIEDAPYREIRFSGQAQPLVSDFCPDHSIVLRSFSKTVAPAMRIGAMTCKHQWFDAMLTVKQSVDLHTNVPMQAVLTEALQHPGMKAHIDNICAIYGERYQHLTQEIRKYLPQCSFDEVEGGMFIWVNLPEGNDAMALADQCLEAGVAVVPSNVFYHDQSLAKPALRLNFSSANKAEISEAIKRLAKIVNVE